MRGEFVKASGARLFSVTATFASGLTNLKLYGDFFTPDVYGIMVVALQLIGYLPMLDGGFRMATNRRLLASEASERQRLIFFSQEVYSWLLVLGFVGGAALMGTYAALTTKSIDGLRMPLLFLVLGACGALSMFASAQANLLLGLGAQAAMSIINGISALLAVGALAGALVAGWDLWAFPISILTSAAATYGLALTFLRLRKIDAPILRFTLNGQFRLLFNEIRHEAWPAFRSQIAIILTFSSDLILASFFCAPSEVAIYGIVSRIVGIARMFLQIFTESAWPFVAARSHGFDRIQDWIVQTNSWFYGLSAGGLVVLLPAFIEWYMGPAWVPNATLCALFVLRFLVIGVSGSASYFLLGKGDFRNVAACMERELTISILLSLLLGPLFGTNGIALAFLVGTAGGTLFPFWQIYARIRGHRVLPLLAKVWGQTALGFLATWAAARWILFHFSLI